MRYPRWLLAALASGLTFLLLLNLIGPSPAPALAQTTGEPTLTATETAEPTVTPTPGDVNLPLIKKEPTLTPTPTNTPTQTPTPTVTGTPPPLTADLYCSVPIMPIDPTGELTSDMLTIEDSGEIADIDVYLNIAHTWVGDLIITLVHEDSNTEVDLLDRPGVSQSNTLGCNGDDIDNILDDDASLSIQDDCSSGDTFDPAYIPGESYQPAESLSDFNNVDLEGDWTLEITDNFLADEGDLNGWCMLIWYAP